MVVTLGTEFDLVKKMGEVLIHFSFRWEALSVRQVGSGQDHWVWCELNRNKCYGNLPLTLRFVSKITE